MSELEIDSKSPSRRLSDRLAEPPELEARVGRCLIVSQTAEKRDLVRQAAVDAGWETIACASSVDAEQAVQRSRFELAWVDIASNAPETKSLEAGGAMPDATENEADESARLRDVCQSIAALPNVLLVICGNENDPQQEIWARQLGVWLYLPGISLDHPEEIAMLCEQAQDVAGGSQNSLM